jgi:hypothetical protein
MRMLHAGTAPLRSTKYVFLKHSYVCMSVFVYIPVYACICSFLCVCACTLCIAQKRMRIARDLMKMHKPPHQTAVSSIYCAVYVKKHRTISHYTPT